VQNFVVDLGLAEGGYDAFFDLVHFVNEGVVAEAFKGALFNQFLACAASYAKSMHALRQAALAPHKFDDSLGVPNSAIRQKIDVRSLALFRLILAKDLGEWLIDAGTAEVSIESGDLLDSVLHVLVVVVDTTLGEHELVARAVAAHVELAALG